MRGHGRSGRSAGNGGSVVWHDGGLPFANSVGIRNGRTTSGPMRRTRPAPAGKTSGLQRVRPIRRTTEAARHARGSSPSDHIRCVAPPAPGRKNIHLFRSPGCGKALFFRLRETARQFAAVPVPVDPGARRGRCWRTRGVTEAVEPAGGRGADGRAGRSASSPRTWTTREAGPGPDRRQEGVTFRSSARGSRLAQEIVVRSGYMGRYVARLTLLTINLTRCQRRGVHERRVRDREPDGSRSRPDLWPVRAARRRHSIFHGPDPARAGRSGTARRRPDPAVDHAGGWPRPAVVPAARAHRPAERRPSLCRARRGRTLPSTGGRWSSAPSSCRPV